MIINMNNIQFINRKPCIDITSEVVIGPSPWEKHLAEKERQKWLPMVISKKKEQIFSAGIVQWQNHAFVLRRCPFNPRLSAPVLVDQSTKLQYSIVVVDRMSGY